MLQLVFRWGAADTQEEIGLWVINNTWQTGRLLRTRLKKHRGAVRGHDTNSCLALHCMDTGHTFNWQDTRILGSANFQRAREAIEALHLGEHSVNQFVQLDPCYRLMRLQHWSICPSSPLAHTISHTVSHFYAPSFPLGLLMMSTYPLTTPPPCFQSSEPAPDLHLNVTTAPLILSTLIASNPFPLMYQHHPTWRRAGATASKIRE